MIVADDKNTFLIAGNGDLDRAGRRNRRQSVPAAHMLLPRHVRLVNIRILSAREIAQEAMQIAGKICIYTNENISLEEL